MPPFMKKLIQNLSMKHAKIFCSIRNLKEKLKDFDEIIPGQTLPAHFSIQQKYYDSLATAEIKQIFVKNLIDNKKAILSKRITENEEIYNSRSTELESMLDPFSLEKCGSSFFQDCKISWSTVLDSYIQIQICTMTAKACQDKLKREQKRKNFAAKKEERTKPKVLTVGEFDKLTAELKALKLSRKSKTPSGTTTKNSSKNSKGEKTAGKSQSPKLQDQKKPLPKRKAKTGSKGSGNTKGTSTKRK